MENDCVNSNSFLLPIYFGLTKICLVRVIFSAHNCFDPCRLATWIATNMHVTFLIVVLLTFWARQWSECMAGTCATVRPSSRGSTTTCTPRTTTFPIMISRYVKFVNHNARLWWSYLIRNVAVGLKFHKIHMIALISQKNIFFKWDRIWPLQSVHWINIEHFKFLRFLMIVWRV